MTDIWHPAKLYPPGSVVAPRSAAPLTSTTLINGDFENGDSGWDYTNTAAYSASGGFSSAKCMTLPPATGAATAINQTEFAVAVGQSVSARCKIKLTGANQTGAITLSWYQDDDTLISTSTGTGVAKSGAWYQAAVTDVAPADASYVRVGGTFTNTGATALFADNFVVEYAYQAPLLALEYEATQSDTETSGNTEPTWPTTVGETVTDGGITWTAVAAARVVWTASPILTTGTDEPTWPTVIGAFVADGTIQWEAMSSYISDEKCPNSKVVSIEASKVFAGDGDITRFCATNDPTDWSTANDAGYLPTGLQQSNANDIAVLAPYRSNLVAMNAACFQNWQVDPDPAQMAKLDQMEGIGSIYQHAAHPVGDELFYLTALGVRSVSVSAASDSLAAGDVGMPIDSLVQAAVAAVATALGPFGMYYPGAGQYWLACNGASNCTVFVYTLGAKGGKWSRYVFPWNIDAFALKGDDLYLRHGNIVTKLDDAAVDDEGADFDGVVQWGWLDLGPRGELKTVEGFKLVGTGSPSFSIGYDETDTSAFTDAYAVDSDTSMDGTIPYEVTAPSMSVKLAFAGGEKWSLNSVTLEVSDL